MGMFSWSTGCDCNKCEPKESIKEKEDKRNQEELEKAKETLMKLNPEQLNSVLSEINN